MTTKETIEGNKLIAEFMGLKTGYAPFGLEYKDTLVIYIQPHKTEPYQKELPRYRDSWDWLMPAVKKILNTDTGTLDVYTLYVSDSLRTADINKVYESVIDFIRFYNNRHS